MQAHELAKIAEREGLTPLDILLGNAERFYQLALGAQANDKSEDEIIYRGLARENADKRAFPIGKRRRRGRPRASGFRPPSLGMRAVEHPPNGNAPSI